VRSTCAEQVTKERVSSPVDRTMTMTIVLSKRKAKYGDSSGVRGAAWLWPAKT